MGSKPTKYQSVILIEALSDPSLMSFWQKSMPYSLNEVSINFKIPAAFVASGSRSKRFILT